MSSKWKQTIRFGVSLLRKPSEKYVLIFGSICFFLILSTDKIWHEKKHITRNSSNTVSSVFDNFQNVNDPVGRVDTAVFWHIPRSAGESMKEILSSCMGFVIVKEKKFDDEDSMNDSLDIIRNDGGNGGGVLNVDTTTPDGIKRAKDQQIIQSHLVDVVFTPLPREASILFDNLHRARLFTFLREPTERIISIHYHRRLTIASRETLEEFVRSHEDNWMVRSLTGYTSGYIGKRHLNLSKEILKKKFLIGLLDQKTESLLRFERYFGWKFSKGANGSCKDDIFYVEWKGRNPHPSLSENGPLMSEIRHRNMWDLEL